MLRFYMVMDLNQYPTGPSFLDRGVAVDYVKRNGGFDRHVIKECELDIKGSPLEYVFQSKDEILAKYILESELKT